MLITKSKCAFALRNLDFTGSARLKSTKTLKYEHNHSHTPLEA